MMDKEELEKLVIALGKLTRTLLSQSETYRKQIAELTEILVKTSKDKQ